jgi:hypothetical protein
MQSAVNVPRFDPVSNGTFQQSQALFMEGIKREILNVEKIAQLEAELNLKDELLNEWLSQWDTIKADGKVSLAEFEEFYKDVSASIDDDEYFEFVITSAWKL